MNRPDEKGTDIDLQEFDPCAAGYLLVEQDAIIDLFETLNPFTTKEHLSKNPDATKRIIALAERFHGATESVFAVCNVDFDVPLTKEDLMAFVNPQVFDDLMDELAGIRSDVEELRIDLQRSALSAKATV